MCPELCCESRALSWFSQPSRDKVCDKARHRRDKAQSCSAHHLPIQSLTKTSRVEQCCTYTYIYIYMIPVRPSPPPQWFLPTPPPLWCGVVVGCFPPPLVVWCGVVVGCFPPPCGVVWFGCGLWWFPPSPPVAWCGLGGSPLHVWICLGCLANPCS